MAENFSQREDGTLVFVNPVDDIRDLHIGGAVPSSTVPRLLAQRVAVLALTASDSAGGVFAWNPGGAILVTDVVVHVKTIATGACTLDIGIAANGTTSNDSLINGLDVHTATGAFDNITDHGTNGKTRKPVTATQYITGSKASGATAGLVGYVYIHYFPSF